MSSARLASWASAEAYFSSSRWNCLSISETGSRLAHHQWPGRYVSPPSIVSQLKFKPSKPAYLCSRWVNTRMVWSLWSNPPKFCMALFSASSPAWPNGVWPRSCANATASAKSSLSCSALAMDRLSAPLQASESVLCENSRPRDKQKPVFYV